MNLSQVKKKIVELNTQSQLFQGKNSDDVDIKPEYTDFTEELKQIKGQPSDRVTLKDSGEFYDSFFVTIASTYFEISAQDIKYGGKLTEKYGDKIIGLSEKSLQELKDFILPLYIQEVRSILRIN